MAETGEKRINGICSELTDKELVELAIRQDRDAFSVLLARYREALISHILKYVSVAEDAEDICQRSLEKAFVNIRQYDCRYAFSTWIYSIAQNEAKDHLRRTRNILASVPLSPDNEESGIPAGPTPEENYIITQAVSDMTARIESLPERYRCVAKLRFIKDYAYEDIAAELRLPIGTVKTRLNRARKMLTPHNLDNDGKTE